MDFNDNQKEADFRIKVREFLDKNAKKRASSKSTTANAAAPETLRGKEAQVKALDAAKIWQAKKAEAGFAGILWPKEFGGLGGTPIEQVIYQQEELKDSQVQQSLFADLSQNTLIDILYQIACRQQSSAR